jgi:hypothetical protein
MPAKTRLDTGRRGAGKISSSLFRDRGDGGPPSPPIMPDFIHFRDRGSTRGNALMLQQERVRFQHTSSISLRR